MVSFVQTINSTLVNYIKKRSALLSDNGKFGLALYSFGPMSDRYIHPWPHVRTNQFSTLAVMHVNEIFVVQKDLSAFTSALFYYLGV